MIRGLVVGLLLFLAACPSSNTTRTDAASNADASPPDGVTDLDGAQAYRHTIVVDGTNDFVSDETFATTSGSYNAYVSWDESSLFIGYDGEDIATNAVDSDQKWLLVYFDVDPGNGTGAAVGEQYNTQAPGFPAGFGAEYYYRWKSDDTFEDLQSFAGGTAWTAEATAINAAVSGTYAEVAIPLAALDGAQSLGVVALMLNEKPVGEWSYAGLYATSFTDGYYDEQVGPIPIAHYLEVDLASPRVPNDAANRHP